MNTPRPHNLPPELLAGYADGELNAADADRVQRWLAMDLDAAADLETQQNLGPSAFGLWQTTEPADPGSLAWNRLHDGIRIGIQRQARRRTLRVWPLARPRPRCW